MIEDIGEFEKVNVTKVQGSLTYGELDAVELLTGMSLGHLQEYRQGLLTRVITVIGLRRQGINVKLAQLENEMPSKYALDHDEDAEEVEEDPTEASD